MKRSVATGLAVLLAALLTGPSLHAAPAALQFGACPPDVAGRWAQMQCASVDVPLDYRAPRGETLRLSISKVPARNPAARRGSLLVNPGGPGASGIDLAGELSSKLPPEVLDAYDLIGFDTRNSGHSQPITCVDPATYWKHPLPDPDSAAARALNWERARQYADGCQQRAGKYLPYLTTPDNARDMDRIRMALGEPRISYLGYSYGTYLGAVYGQLFPQHVDRMILDSSVDPDPSAIWYRDNLNQDIPAQQRLDEFFDWAARYDGVFHLGTDRAQVNTVWTGIRDELRTAPRGPLGPSEFIEMSFYALYSERGWTQLARAISDYHVRHDDHALIAQIAPKDEAAENNNAVYNAVECADAAWPTQPAQWELDTALVAPRSPMSAWFNTWSVAPCAYWHGPHESPVRITGQRLPPVLMFNSVRDMATPYQGALVLHRSLPTSVLITEDAGEHGVFSLVGNPAADRLGNDYLVHGTLPARDVSIPGHPLPDPTKPGGG